MKIFPVSSVKLVLLFMIILFTSSYIQAMERDYHYDGWPIEEGQEPDYTDENEEEHFLYASNELCKQCFRMGRYTDKLDITVIPPLKKRHIFNWPNWKSCGFCGRYEPFYGGYLHFMYKNDFPFLKKQINYTKKYPDYQAYWPETSVKAEKISNMVVKTLENLFSETELGNVWKNKELLDNFVTSSWEFDYWDYRKSFAYKSLAASTFRFSDFCLIFDELKFYSQQWFSQQESEKISDKLEQILDDLSAKFLDMYEESLALHPTQEIQEEVDFIHFLYEKNSYQKHLAPPQSSKQILKNSRLINKSKKRKQKSTSVNKSHHLRQKKDLSNSCGSCQPDWFMAEYYLLLGTTYNNLFLHAEAVNALSNSLRLDPTKIDTYKERAHAYFELNEINLAIKDYWKCKELEDQQPPYMKHIFLKTRAPIKDGLRPKGGMDYTSGFCLGVVKGGNIALVEFVPSTLSCCRGVLHGLWSFACSPGEVSKDVINASFSLVEYLKTHTTKESLETVIPELKDLLSNWDGFSNFERGEKVGYVIGKYGVDILIPGTALKGIKKFRQLKRTNTMFTIECCAVSQAKKGNILKRSSKHAEARKIVCESAKKGKVVPRNAHVITHVMQEKHAWNKLITPSGNLERDFKRVITLLEENGILSEKCFIRSREFHRGKLIRSDYRKVINGHEVQAAFETYVETNQTFLKDAWVITK